MATSSDASSKPLRQSYDFDSVAAYQGWLETTAIDHNRRPAAKVDDEWPSLRALPRSRAATYPAIPARL
jgi:hypothetical protein